MSGQLDNLPDFLTLYSKDSLNPGIITQADFTWNLPDSYYSNQRANNCYVSIVDCFSEELERDAVAPAINEQAYLIVLYDGASNYHSTDNAGIVLGGYNLRPKDTNFTYDFAKTGGMLQALIAARPQTIRLAITDLNGVIIRMANPPFLWVITLRFDYVNQEQQIEGMLNTFTNNLLPPAGGTR
jgi:hypothetical protein